MNLRHYDHDGRARFVTFCTHRRLPLLSTNAFRKIITDCLGELRREYQFRLIAYVIMPEHVHPIIVPKEETALGEMIRVAAGLATPLAACLP
jgi:putative transposase